MKREEGVKSISIIASAPTGLGRTDCGRCLVPRWGCPSWLGEDGVQCMGIPCFGEGKQERVKASFTRTHP